MSPKLYIYPRRGDPSHYSLYKENVSIGRASDNDIPTYDPYSSNTHAFLVTEGGKYYIQDNRSKNGIFVNSTKIETRAELNKGDEILIGGTRFVFDQEAHTRVEITDEASSTGINTVFPIKDILQEPDACTVFQNKSKNLII